MPCFDIHHCGLSARITDFGARLMELRVETARGPLNVGLGLAESAYEADMSAMGAICGRYANRIGGAAFPLNGTPVRLDANAGGHCLHGGIQGFGLRRWTLEDRGPHHVALRLDSPAGDMGFPGFCQARALYRLSPGQLEIVLEAEVDAPCPINLVAHPYFNLHGGGNVDGHGLQILSGRRLVVDDALIPTGAFADVGGGPFDFLTLKTLQTGDTRYDLSYVWDSEGTMRHAARLESPLSGIGMDVFTDQPSLQFYDGAFLPKPYSGLCLEAQRYPDAPNHAHFPSSLVRPGEVSRQVVRLRFDVDEKSPATG